MPTLPPPPPSRNPNLFESIDYLVKAAVWLVQESLNTRHHQEKLMATVAELEASLDTIGTALTGTQTSIENLAGDLTGLKNEIQALKDQVAAGSPASQEQLDGLFTKTDGIATRATATAQALSDLAASTPEAPAPEA